MKNKTQLTFKGTRGIGDFEDQRPTDQYLGCYPKWYGSHSFLTLSFSHVVKPHGHFIHIADIRLSSENLQLKIVYIS